MIEGLGNRSLTEYKGGLTVYCFGDPSKMSDESVRLSLRIHDEVCMLLTTENAPGSNWGFAFSAMEATYSDPISAPAGHT